MRSLNDSIDGIENLVYVSQLGAISGTNPTGLDVSVSQARQH